jgi:hypothetical protein
VSRCFMVCFFGFVAHASRSPPFVMWGRFLGHSYAMHLGIYFIVFKCWLLCH